MIGLIHLDDGWKKDLARHSIQVGHQITNVPAAAESVSIPLTGATGEPIGYLGWDHPNIGRQLRVEILPGILLVCLMIFAISLGAAHYFYTQHRSHQRQKILALTDQLTGIRNRAGLDQIIRSHAIIAQIADGAAALIYVDLNDFKSLNDNLGHKAGDEALQAMARALQSAVRETDIVARLSGDEFVCLIHHHDPRQACDAVTARIKSILENPIQLAGVTYSINPSIGVAVAGKGFQWDTLLSQADAAMYWAKRRASPDAAYYDEIMQKLPLVSQLHLLDVCAVLSSRAAQTRVSSPVHAMESSATDLALSMQDLRAILAAS